MLISLKVVNRYKVPTCKGKNSDKWKTGIPQRGESNSGGMEPSKSIPWPQRP